MRKVKKIKRKFEYNVIGLAIAKKAKKTIRVKALKIASKKVIE